MNHKILLEKLKNCGIRGVVLDWFDTYVSSRKQFVSNGNISSQYNSISCGVPQGSVLGPLFFLLYTNDFSCSSKGFLLSFIFKIHDSNLFFGDRSIDNLQETGNIEIKKIQTWLCTIKLSLNIGMSNFVIFHTAQKRSNNTISFKINNKTIKQQNLVKYLGHMLDRNLNWTEQVCHLSKKVSRGIGIISTLRHFVGISLSISVSSNFWQNYPILPLVPFFSRDDTDGKNVKVLLSESIE